jgi:hypothetical protein
MENTNTKRNRINDNYILHKANTRGHANHVWLESFHFSFAGYQYPERMQFGVCGC